MKKALAFDIGGTKIYSTVVDEAGKIITEIEKFSTPKTIGEIKEILTSQISKHENDVDIVCFRIKMFDGEIKAKVTEDN